MDGFATICLSTGKSPRSAGRSSAGGERRTGFYGIHVVSDVWRLVVRPPRSHSVALANLGRTGEAQQELELLRAVAKESGEGVEMGSNSANTSPPSAQRKTAGSAAAEIRRAVISCA